MTTFHDPPPQSRRAARQSERAHASDQNPTVDGFTTFPTQDAAANDEAPVRNGAPQPPATGQPTSVPAPQAPSQHTQVQGPATAVPSHSAPAPSTPQPTERSMHDSYRSAPPPTSRAQSSFAPAAPQSAAPAQATPETAAPRSAESFPEKTLTRREMRELRAREEASQQPPSAAPTFAAPVTETPKVAAPPTPTPVVATPEPTSVAQQPQLYIEPPSLVDPLSVVPETAARPEPQGDSLSAFEALLASADGSPGVPSANNAPKSPLAGLQPNDAAETDVTSAPKAGFDVVQSPPTATAPGELRSDVGQSRPQIEGLLGLAPEVEAEPDSVSSTSSSTNLSNARAEFDELARQRLDAEVLPAISSPATPPEPTSPASLATDTSAAAAPSTIPASSPSATTSASSTRTGHWSEQAKADDDNDHSGVTRTVGSGSSATSALVLPAIPFATDIRGPLTSNGEAMLTGSIDLPSTLSASGVSDRFDHDDIDSLLDLNDSDMVSTDSAPVRAVKAVSTFSNQSVTQTQKPKGTRALTALMISAVSMSVVVAGLLVAAFVFNML